MGKIFFFSGNFSFLKKPHLSTRKVSLIMENGGKYGSDICSCGLTTSMMSFGSFGSRSKNDLCVDFNMILPRVQCASATTSFSDSIVDDKL